MEYDKKYTLEWISLTGDSMFAQSNSVSSDFADSLRDMAKDLRHKIGSDGERCEVSINLWECTERGRKFLKWWDRT